MTLSLPLEVEAEIRRHPEIKWTEVARAALLEKADRMSKLEILEKYLDKIPLADEDKEWMEEHDWHPVDERDFQPGFAMELEKISRGKFRKISSLAEIR